MVLWEDVMCHPRPSQMFRLWFKILLPVITQALTQQKPKLTLHSRYTADKWKEREMNEDRGGDEGQYISFTFSHFHKHASSTCFSGRKKICISHAKRSHVTVLIWPIAQFRCCHWHIQFDYTRSWTRVSKCYLPAVAKHHPWAVGCLWPSIEMLRRAEVKLGLLQGREKHEILYRHSFPAVDKSNGNVWHV